MTTRYRIKTTAGAEVLDLAEREAFRFDGVHYPGDWLTHAAGTGPDADHFATAAALR